MDYQCGQKVRKTAQQCRLLQELQDSCMPLNEALDFQGGANTKF